MDEWQPAQPTELEKTKKSALVWRIVAIISLCLLAVTGTLLLSGRSEDPGPSRRIPGEQALSLWSADARAKKELIAYVEAVTNENSKDFIPEEDRIAVFDLDGTLFCETDPNYFDYTLLAYRVLEDPAYKDRASDFEREVAGKIAEQNRTGASFSGLEVDHGRAVASAFAGMTIGEFNRYIQEFKKLPMPGYEGMTRGEG